MKRMKAAIAPIALVGIMAFGLFGCGATNDNEADSGDTAVQTSEQQSSTVQQDTATESGADAQQSVHQDAAVENDSGATQDEQQEPVEIDLDDFIALRQENVAKAQKEYDGKFVKTTGYVISIHSDYCSIATGKGSKINNMNVYLPTDVLAELSKDEKITVVGIMVFDLMPGQVAGGVDIRNAEIVE